MENVQRHHQKLRTSVYSHRQTPGSYSKISNEEVKMVIELDPMFIGRLRKADLIIPCELGREKVYGNSTYAVSDHSLFISRHHMEWEIHRQGHNIK